MKEERDFAGFVLSFAIGTFIATCSTSADYTHYRPYATLSLGATVLLLFILMYKPMRSKRDIPAGIIVILTGLASGCFTGYSSMICGTSAYGSTFTLRLEEAGKWLGTSIDRIGFASAETNAVLKALITGERGDIPASVSEAFRDSGASHILALSGFHLGIIYGIISRPASLLGGSRGATLAKGTVTVALCGLYTLATGAGPSIVRAFIFILLGECARLSHRKTTTASVLISALLIQLAVNPLSIRTVSFQLSYAAMAGIAYVFPYLKNLWKADENNNWPVLRKIWNSAAMSASCQLTTGPLAYHYFGTFPKYFLLTNLIALPLTTLTIPSALLTIVMSSFGICPVFLLQATEFLVTSLIRSLEIIAGM